MDFLMISSEADLLAITRVETEMRQNEFSLLSTSLQHYQALLNIGLIGALSWKYSWNV